MQLKIVCFWKKVKSKLMYKHVNSRNVFLTLYLSLCIFLLWMNITLDIRYTIACDTEGIYDKNTMQNRESTEGYSKSIVRKNNDKFGKGLVSTSRTYASPKGTGPGVRRSKHPLSACHTRRKCSMETTQNSVKGQVRYKVWSVGVVIVYGQVTECHLTFVRGKLHIVW